RRDQRRSVVEEPDHVDPRRAAAQRNVRRSASDPHQRAQPGLHEPRQSCAAEADWSGSRRGAVRAQPREAGRGAGQETDCRHRRGGAEGRRSSRLAPLIRSPRVPAPAVILLVEDKDSLRTMLRLALERQGHTVLEAKDQPEAVKQLQQGQPAVVLSDLRLPEGDGFGVLRASKEIDPDVPVIVMTAYGSIEDAVAAMKEGALDFLAKPVDPDHLMLLVSR